MGRFRWKTPCRLLYQEAIATIMKTSKISFAIVTSLLALCAVLLFTGCVSTNNVAKPSNITLVNALRGVGSRMAEMQAAEISTFATNKVLNRYGTDDFITGLFP